MADRSGYIGRAPGDSSVIIARQTFEPTGIQTDFTFTSGYTPGYIDVYLNGSRLIVASDYTATDGSVVGLTTNAINGDVLECVAYKAFNLGNVNSAIGNFTVGGDLTVTGTSNVVDLTVTGTSNVGVVTGGTYYGDGSNLTGISSVSYATTSFGLSGSPNIAVNNITGVAVTFSGAADFNGALDVDGHTELDDVNVSGFSTFTKFVDINESADISGGLNVSGITTFNDNVKLLDDDKLQLGTGGDLEVYHDGSNSYIADVGTGELRIRGTTVRITDNDGTENFADFNDNGAVDLYYDNAKKFETTGGGVVVTGVCTATSFSGNGANLTGTVNTGKAIAMSMIFGG